METVMFDDQSSLEEIVLSLQEDFNEELFGYLIKRVEPLIRSTVRRYTQQHIEFDDLYQECVIALYQAVLKYDINKKSYFVSYYAVLVRRHILTLIKKYYTAKRGLGKSWMDISMNDPFYQSDYSRETLENYIKSTVLTGEDISVVKEVFEDYVSNLEDKEGYHIYLCAKGHSIKEISDETGYTLNQTRYLHRKYRQNFDDLLFD
ncbi:sigma-70 family RNA polymerase sigma factor [Aerococcaceae bacterium DSM 111176]|nr:sigma-70 family RNA polymerase sigma factor [Aerococcaceae bacterium DSM 111176]